MLKKVIIYLLILIFPMTFLVSCSGVSEKEYTEVSSQLTASKEENEKLQNELTTLQSNYNILNDDYTQVKTKCDEYEEIIEPYKELSETEIELKTKEEKAELEKLNKEEEEKKAKEKAAKEAEEKKGYNTGITYEQLARNPDDYEGKKVKFTGEVIQVIEGDSSIQLRVAVNSQYNQILLVEYDSSIVKSRILEDDIITVYGVSCGLISYQSSMGGTITIPFILVDKIDQ